MKFQRKIVDELEKRTSESPQFMQIVVGPRQVGKTTAVTQLIGRQTERQAIYSSADSAGIPDSNWITSQWRNARSLAEEHGKALLVLDEVQLVPEWQRTVKAHWDEDRRTELELHVIITGSSALLLQKGSESLSGRFEKHELLQWSFLEMKEAFGFELDEYLYYGGYPGAAPLRDDDQRWKSYVKSSLIETVLTKDIIALSNITKPSLLQQLFKIVSSHPAEIVAYNKILGQLADAGNVTTLSDYRMLLEQAYLLKVLPKWSGSQVRKRASKPKWILRDNALVTAMQPLSFIEIQKTPFYGRLAENAVIAHLLRLNPEGYYWREKNDEVDYVFQHKRKPYALEIKSGRQIRSKSGLNAFQEGHKDSIALIIGAGGGISIEEILLAEEWKW